MADLAVVILTRNEERHLGRAIASVRGVARDIVVVDSFSDDETENIANTLGVRFFKHPFKNYGDQFQWALDNTGITAQWIMRLDADEYIEPALERELEERLADLPDDVSGIDLRLKRIFMGRWVRFGGCTMRLLRIWRRGRGRIENRWMDEHIILDRGRQISFQGRFCDHNLNDITFFTAKHNAYATREAIDVLLQRRGLLEHFDSLSATTTISSAVIKKAIKERLYNKVHPLLAVTAYMIFRYVFLLGFLDGVAGTYYHFLQGAWYRLLVGVKVGELMASVPAGSTRSEALAILAKCTGHKVD